MYLIILYNITPLMDYSTNIVDVLYLDYNLYNICKVYRNTVYMKLLDKMYTGDENVKEEDTFIEEDTLMKKDTLMKGHSLECEKSIDNATSTNNKSINTKEQKKFTTNLQRKILKKKIKNLRNVGLRNKFKNISNGDLYNKNISNGEFHNISDNLSNSKNFNNNSDILHNKNFHYFNDNLNNENINIPTTTNLNKITFHSITLDTIKNTKYDTQIVKTIFSKLKNTKYDTQLISKFMYIKTLQLLTNTTVCIVDKVNKYYRDMHKQYCIPFVQFESFNCVLLYCEGMYQKFDVPYLFNESVKLIF